MSVYKITDLDYKDQLPPEYEECTRCGKHLTKYINFDEMILCPACAQNIMRILLQDLIEYHNEKSVSLLNIFYHGGQEGEFWNPGPKNKLYDRDLLKKWQETGE